MSVLSASTQEKVEESLVAENLLTREQLGLHRANALKMNTPLFSYLVHENLISSEQLTKTVAKVTNVPYVNLSEAKLETKVLELLPKDLAERYMAVPLGEVKNRLAVAMLDSSNLQAVDFLASKLGKPLTVYLATEEGIRNVLKQYGLVSSGNTAQEQTSGTAQSDKTSGGAIAVTESEPISKILASVLEFAVHNRASDIHIEPLEKELKIRCRIDGILREVMKLPKSSEPPLISRIKILSSLKIDEHRTPQDGQFTTVVDERNIDLRIAISPVVWGEQVVIRLLDKSGTSLMLEDMGFKGRALRTIRKGLERPNGMILTSGPTGSGKSTSLYALIQEIMSDEINIVTLEDPVEYKMQGINQIQVNADVGLTFATGLRSILRQDPDVVMVGEIRDKETATLAVQAALTGHLVFSTLHTNSAAGILPRLLDMGIEPFLIASTVHTVIGQRLVRRVRQDDGRLQYASDKTETESIKKVIGHLLPQQTEHAQAACEDLGYKSLPLANQNAYTLYKGKDEPDTPGGYKGRMGLYEVFEVNETIQQLILQRATSAEIQRIAQEQGMITMYEDGYLKALAGMTTLKEVNRVSAAESA